MKISEDFTVQVMEKLDSGASGDRFTREEIEEISSWTNDIVNGNSPIPQQIVFNYGIDTSWQDLAKHLVG